jgi:hypothetical protein
MTSPTTVLRFAIVILALAGTITEIRTTRAGKGASTYVHLARDGGAMKVAGIYRR